MAHPTPWRLSPSRKSEWEAATSGHAHHNVEIVDRYGDTVLGVSEWITLDWEDAKLIVNAVNKYRAKDGQSS